MTRINMRRTTWAAVMLTAALLVALAPLHVLRAFAVAPPAAAATAAQPSVAIKTLCEGTPFATECYTVDSGKPGPTVFIGGGSHGNEPAGAAAADQIRTWPLACGRLIVVPYMNKPGLTAKTRTIPAALAPAAENNLNRNYPSDKKLPIRGPLARAIWAEIEAARPDWVLDLHEGWGYAGHPDSGSVGSSIIPSREVPARQMAQEMLDAVNASLDDESRRFALSRLPIEGSLARGASERLGIPAMTIETTSAGQPLATRVRQHRIMVLRLLSRLKMVTGDFEPRP